MFNQYRPRNLLKCFHTSSALLKTFYEILEVEKSCTTKQIRAAYIKLSKQLHPDHNPQNPESHKKFVLVNQAYQVLNNPGTRALYDIELRNVAFSQRYAEDLTNHAEFAKYRQTWRDESFWSTRDRSKDKFYEGKPYYGIKGVNRMSNVVIAIGCTLFMLIGATGHYFAIQYGRGMTTERLNAQDQKNSEIYMRVREQARLLGKERQLELLKELEKSKGSDSDD